MQNTLYTGDNLRVMGGLNSASVDLIYLDPPFNSKRTYSAALDSKAAGVSFKDVWSWRDVEPRQLEQIRTRQPPLARLIELTQSLHSQSMAAYLAYMTLRLLELHRILKATGSLYLHCDPSASHYLKLGLDRVFGTSNFRNEIIWYYYNKYSAGKRAFGRNFDQILFYTKSNSFIFNQPREARDKPQKQLLRENLNGVLKNKKSPAGKVLYRMVTDKKVDAIWRLPCLQPASQEWNGYPTQKPLALLHRIIETSSREGDVVLDPFCGSATTCVAAQQLGRKWIGIDTEDQVAHILRNRLSEEAGLGKEFAHRRDTPTRDDSETSSKLD